MAAKISVEDCARETYMRRTSTSARTSGSDVCRNPRLSSSEPVIEERDEHARERAASLGHARLTPGFSNVAATLKDLFGALSLIENIIMFNKEQKVMLNPKCSDTSMLTSMLKVKGNLEEKTCNVDSNFNLGGKSATLTETSI